MDFLPKQVLVEILNHWDKKEKLCPDCEVYFSGLTTSQRREIRHDYEKEKE